MILPTARAAMLAALAAPLALVLAAILPAAWVVVPAAGAALLVLVVLDGLVAGRMADIRLIAPADAEVGAPFTLHVLAEITGRQGRGTTQVALACDPRLAEGGRVEWALAAPAADGPWQGTHELAANRRGTAAISALWLRWSGPLGLGARVERRPLDHAIRIWPDLAPVRSPALQACLRDADFGLIARRMRGEGSQFEALAEYQPGMDRRRIDWKSSARATRLLAREYESERNNPIVFALDCGQAMCEPLDGLPRIDRAVTAALTAAWVALKGGDRVALFGFARKPEVATPFQTGTAGFHRLQTAAASLEYRAEEPNFTLALATLGERLKRRSLIVLFSDFTDPTSAELMVESIGRLLAHHVVIFVAMEDTELENLASAEPDTVSALATAVSADTLARQRALVLLRLRQLGVDVIEAPHDRIGFRLIDRYLTIKRTGAIG